MENFYQLRENAEGKSIIKKFLENKTLRNFIRFYFESKSKAILA